MNDNPYKDTGGPIPAPKRALIITNEPQTGRWHRNSDVFECDKCDQIFMTIIDYDNHQLRSC